MQVNEGDFVEAKTPANYCFDEPWKIYKIVKWNNMLVFADPETDEIVVQWKDGQRNKWYSLENAEINKKITSKRILKKLNRKGVQCK